MKMLLFISGIAGCLTLHAGYGSKAGWGDSYYQDPQAKTQDAEPFFALPLTAEDKRNIRKLITAMADKNVIQLFLEQGPMEHLGDRVRPVHPLRFIGFILADPYLCRCLQMVAEDSIKWSHFMKGYEESMKKEKESQLLVCSYGFAELLNIDPEYVQGFIERKDYIGLVKSLLYMY